MHYVFRPNFGRVDRSKENDRSVIWVGAPGGKFRASRCCLPKGFRIKRKG